MKRTREALVEYLSRQQHAAYEEAGLIEGWDTHRDARWSATPEARRATMRTSVSVVLDELEDLKLLRLPRELQHTR